MQSKRSCITFRWISPSQTEGHIALRNRTWCNAIAAGIVREATMASAKFFRRQAELFADLAQRTNDEESRHRYERLQHTYCYLADTEQETVEASGDTSRR